MMYLPIIDIVLRQPALSDAQKYSRKDAQKLHKSYTVTRIIQGWNVMGSHETKQVPCIELFSRDSDASYNPTKLSNIISKQVWPVRTSPSVPPIPAGTKPDAEDRSRSSPRPRQAPASSDGSEDWTESCRGGRTSASLFEHGGIRSSFRLRFVAKLENSVEGRLTMSVSKWRA